MKRIKTGIENFDRIVGGGIPTGSAIMISGCAGAGKSIFTLQTLCYRASKGERGLYITFEQEPEDIIEQAQEFKWDIDAHIKKGLIKIAKVSAHGPRKLKHPDVSTNDKALVEKLINGVLSEIASFKPKHVVIDSLSTIGSSLRSDVPDTKKRDVILDLIEVLKGEKIDLILVTSEIPRSGEWYSSDGVSEYVVDGIIILHKISTGMGVSRMISVEKMRKTNHYIERFPLSIKDDIGISIEIADETLK